MSQKYDFGMIGLGVMGSNLLYNIADHGFSVIGFDLSSEKAQNLEKGATEGTKVKGVTAIEEFVSQLSVPRKIMLLVPAGKPVDAVIDNLIPHLEKGDIIIDGGNSHYVDTVRRVKYVSEKGFHFMGMGVSGGEEGARRGPSIMPGGDVEAFKLRELLEKVAARDFQGSPCLGWFGGAGSGHYVKMVHNGIEYGMMQSIAEGFNILKNSGFEYSLSELADLYQKKSVIESRLVEWLRDGFKKYGEDLEGISGEVSASGEGEWTVQTAKEKNLLAESIELALNFRTKSKGNPSFVGKLLSTMRTMFGGHDVKEK